LNSSANKAQIVQKILKAKKKKLAPIVSLKPHLHKLIRKNSNSVNFTDYIVMSKIKMRIVPYNSNKLKLKIKIMK